MQKSRQQFCESLRKEHIGALLAEKRRKVIEGNSIHFSTDNLMDACLELKRVRQMTNSTAEDVNKVVKNLQMVSTGAMGDSLTMKDTHLEIIMDSGSIDYLMDVLSPIHEHNTEMMTNALWIIINAFTANDFNNRLHSSGIIHTLLVLLDQVTSLEVADHIIWALRNAVTLHTDTRDYLVQKDIWPMIKHKMEALYRSDEGSDLTPDEVEQYQVFVSNIVKLALSFLKVSPSLAYRVVCCMIDSVLRY